MIIKMIAAMASNYVIGNKNTLPRHYSADLQHFKKLTTGNIIVMWYNTYVSLGKALPKRRNIVLSKIPLEGVETYESIENLLKHFTQEEISEFFVIGWASIYAQFIDKTDILYLTEIKKEYDGDTYFPDFKDKFIEQEREIGEDMDFVVYKKNKVIA